MPRSLRLAQVNPVKSCASSRGATIRDVAQPIGILAIFGVVALTLAVREYGRRVG
ncbi:MAG TPA: hypothetical protein VEM14_02670 [Gemmatimonadaceae bacterium]|nr:hypothetical protein [Gemmatimonadaceae bacterium]